MNTQVTKMFAIEQAIKLVSSMEVTNKTKAVFDLADSIESYIGVTDEKENPFEDLEPIVFDDHVQKYM